MSCAIQVQNLHVRYRSKKGESVEAVHDLSFEVKPGEVVGFLGPNGAGKSSTLKALMGFVEPSGGSCSVFGASAGSIEAKRRIGYLPEVALYYPYLTPLETLTLYGELQGLRGIPLRTEALDLLELVGLKDAAHKLNRALSKGMLQRVGIAQSLLGSPELLILDEVTSGLDPVGRKELRRILRERQKGGCTLFFSSHELSEVEMLCDRILLIHKGRLIEERQIDELKDTLRQYRLTYSGEASLAGLTEDWREKGSGVFEASFETKDNLLRGLEQVQKEKCEVLDVVSQEGSLEDYFVETIGRAA
jgi:ABC-2 type transport system ATP-binding protein